MVLVTAACFWVLDVDDISRAFARASPAPVLAAVAIRAGALVIEAWGFRAIAAAMGHRFGMGTAVLLELGSMPLKLVTPAKAGDLTRPAYLARKLGVPPAEALGALLVAKVLIPAANGLVAAVGLVLWGRELEGVLLGAGSLGALVAAPWLARRLAPLGGRIAAWTSAIVRGFAALGPARLCGLAVLFATTQGAEVAGAWLCSRAVGVEVPLGAFLALYSVAVFAGYFPFTPSGFGVREGSAAALLQTWAAPEVAFAGALAGGVVNYLLPAIVGLPLVPALLRGVQEGRR